MEKFQINFKDDTDRKIVMMTMLAGIVFGFLAFGVTSFVFGNNLSEQSKKIINAFLNFDLILLVVFLVIACVPFVNWFSFIVDPILFILNLVIIIKALKIINDNGKEIEIPVILTIF